MGVGDCTSLKRPFQILIMGINPYPPSPSAKGPEDHNLENPRPVLRTDEEFHDGSSYGSFRKLGVPNFGVLIARILLFSVLYQAPLFSETPI